MEYSTRKARVVCFDSRQNFVLPTNVGKCEQRVRRRKNGDSSSSIISELLVFLDRKWNILETYVLISSHMADINVLEKYFVFNYF